MFKNKTAIITGASTGIGRAIAVRLAADEVSVALIARPSSRLEQTKKMIEEAGGSAWVFPCDLKKADQIENITTEIKRKFSSIDIIVNCAGVWHNDDTVYAGKLLQETPVEQIHEVFQVTLLAPFLLTKALLPRMIRTGSGKILQISGTFESGASGWLHYYVAKKALEHFSEGLAQELRQYEIQVNTISPSDTLTDAYQRFFPNTPREQCVTPQEIASLACFLLSEKADHITGACIAVRAKSAH